MKALAIMLTALFPGAPTPTSTSTSATSADVLMIEPPAPPKSDSRRELTDGDPRIGAATTAAPSKEWYGWQPLLTDAASIAVVIAGISEENVPVIVAGSTTYFLTPPLLHGLHEDYGALAASAALRTGVGVVAAIGLDRKDGPSHELEGLGRGMTMAIALGVTVLLTTAIDAVALSWDEVEE